MATELPTPGEIRFRFEQVDRRVDDVAADVKEVTNDVRGHGDVLGKLLTKLAVVEVEQRQVRSDVQALADRFKGVIVGLWAIAAAFVGVALAVLAAAGRLG